MLYRTVTLRMEYRTFILRSFETSRYWTKQWTNKVYSWICGYSLPNAEFAVIRNNWLVCCSTCWRISKRNGKTIIIEMVYVSSICRNIPEVLHVIVPLWQRKFYESLIGRVCRSQKLLCFYADVFLQLATRISVEISDILPQWWPTVYFVYLFLIFPWHPRITETWFSVSITVWRHDGSDIISL